MTQGTCVMPDMLRHLEAGGNILVVRGRQGQARRWPQQGTLVLNLPCQGCRSVRQSSLTKTAPERRMLRHTLPRQGCRSVRQSYLKKTGFGNHHCRCRPAKESA